MTHEDGGDLVEDVDGLLGRRALVDGFFAGHCRYMCGLVRLDVEAGGVR